MASMTVSLSGPTRKISARALVPRKRMIAGRSMASRGYRLKPSGALWVDRRGTISGVGVSPELSDLDLTGLLTSVTSVGLKTLDAVKSLKIPKVAAPRAPSEAPANRSGGGDGAFLTQMIQMDQKQTMLLVGVLALALLLRK